MGWQMLQEESATFQDLALIRGCGWGGGSSVESDCQTKALPYLAVYNAYPCFCAHYTWDYYTHFYAYGM